MASLEFRILGPLELWRAGERIAIPAPKQRALLGFLLIHSNEVVPQETLIEQLWGQDPPATARASLHNHVHALRGLLGDGVLERQPTGYVLHVERGQLDLERFERLATDARNTEPTLRAATLREALACWRGPPLVEFPTEPFAQHEINRLEEERLSALEDRIDADLELGQHTAIVAELQTLVDRFPLRERLWAQLMIALYRVGRQADALAAYKRAHEAFVGDLGIEPGVVLRELQRAILVQDPALDNPAGRIGSTLERVAAILPRTPAERAESLYDYAVSLLRLGDHREAAATLRAAERAAVAAGERSIEERARLYLSYLAVWTEGKSPLAHLEQAERASRRFEEYGDEIGSAVALRQRAQMTAWIGRIEDAVALAIAGVEHAARSGDIRLEASCRGILPALLAAGPMPVEDAIRRCEEPLPAEAEGEPRLMVPRLYALTRLHTEAGRPDVARGMGEAAIRIARTGGLVPHLFEATLWCGAAEFSGGDVGAAIDHLRSAQAIRETVDDHVDSPLTTAWLALALAAAGERDEAEELALRARDSVGPDGFEPEVLWRRALALVAAREGQLSEAIELVAEARARTSTADLLTLHGETLEDVATVQMQAGESSEGTDALTEALAAYRRKGNVVGAERVRRRLASL